MEEVQSTIIIKQEVYHHHKILVVKRQMSMEDGTIESWYCGYVSRNRIDKKIKLNVSSKEVYDYMEENAICFGGVTFCGQLTDPVNFMGDVIGFDTFIPSIEPINESDVIQDTKELCDQLVAFENQHILAYRQTGGAK